MTDTVTNRQMFFIIVARIAAGSILQLPLIMAQRAETGALFVLFIASLLTCIPVIIIVYLGKVFQNKTLYEYSQIIAGKALTYIFAAVYIIYHFGIMTFITRSTAETIKSEILNKTSIYATMFVLIIAVGYAVSKKLTDLGRIIEILGVITFVVSLILHIIMFFQGDIKNAQPFFDVSELNTYFKALPATVFLFIGFESITIIPFSESMGKKAIKTAVLAVLVSGMIYIRYFNHLYGFGN